MKIIKRTEAYNILKEMRVGDCLYCRGAVIEKITSESAERTMDKSRKRTKFMLSVASCYMAKNRIWYSL